MRQGRTRGWGSQMRKPKTCRSCGSRELMLFLSLGSIPLSSILRGDCLADFEERRSLEAAFCKRCSLVQLVSDLLVNAAPTPLVTNLLEELPGDRWIGPGSVVLALEGSSLAQLRSFRQAGAKVIYLEPHPERVRGLSGRDLLIRNERFGRSYAATLHSEGLRADVILANQLPSYHADLNGLFEGLAMLLSDKGTVVMELLYVLELLETRRFERFSHQQAYYFSVRAVHGLARRHGLWIQDIEPLAEGYLRYFLSKTHSSTTSVDHYLEQEQKLGLNDALYYLEFAARTAAVREALVALLTELRARGRRVAAYGASSQGMVLLNYAGLGREVIEFVVDPDASKQGCFLAGVHIPIYPLKKLPEQQPNYLLLLEPPPRQEDAQLKAYLQGGGKFILALPHPEILKPI